MKTRFFVLAAAFLAAGLYSSQAQHDGTNATAPAPSVVKKPEEIQFKHPSFTFVRVRHSAGSRGQGSWATDFPEADRNFAVRFQKVTGLLSDTNVLELTDSRLKQQPFIYISEGGQLALKPEEVKALRDYLLNGGFLMVDDFWGEMEWQVLSAEFRFALPMERGLLSPALLFRRAPAGFRR